MLAATIALFGGVFLGDLLTGGAPAIDHCAYGTFLGISRIALAILTDSRAVVPAAASEG